MINKVKIVPVLVAITLFVLIGGTSAYAEKTVPGDLLYDFKININESAAGVFALSKEEKTEWQERLVERRLAETYKLIYDNKFNEAIRIEMENQIKYQIEKFSTNLEELALEDGESIHSSDLNIRLLASLSAYQNVIRRLSEATSIEIETRQEADNFIHAIVESSSLVKSKSIAVLSLHTDSILAKKAETERILSSTKLSYLREKTKLSPDVQSRVASKLASAQTLLQEGEELISSSDDIRATDKFQASVNLINEAKLFMLSNIIKDDIEHNTDMDDSGDIDDEDGFD